MTGSRWFLALWILVAIVLLAGCSLFTGTKLDAFGYFVQEIRKVQTPQDARTVLTAVRISVNAAEARYEQSCADGRYSPCTCTQLRATRQILRESGERYDAYIASFSTDLGLAATSDQKQAAVDKFHASCEAELQGVGDALSLYLIEQLAAPPGCRTPAPPATANLAPNVAHAAYRVTGAP